MSPKKKDDDDEGKTAMAEPAAGNGAQAPDKKAQTEAVLGDILRLMGYPAKLDFKDAVDGGLSVAMHFEVGEVPFAAAGKRSFVIDSMQFLLNKVVNRPNTEKRWVSLGVGEHPSPRPQRNTPTPQVPMTPVPAAATPSNGMQAAGKDKGHGGGGHAPAPAAAPARAAHHEEPAVEVKADPKMAALATALAEKAAKFGRPLAVMLVDTEDRVRLQNAGKAVKGQSTRVEGEGHNRRVVFAPDKPVPMPKKTAFPVFDVEEEDDE
jgi:predicted RNA-binding protein Jag